VADGNGGLGVGLVYWPELAPLAEDGSCADVLEIEPQAFWEKVKRNGRLCYKPNWPLLRALCASSKHKLIHSVGNPVGGTCDDPLDYLTPLQQTIDLLKPAWVSEHLSFNRVRAGNGCADTGLLLPPRQTELGAARAVHNIARLSSKIALPVAFETGVNYLEPRDDELPDGQFFAQVAESGDCGILLDLHNLWCNEKNGRQTVREVVESLPAERVWELHLAGGTHLDGYLLDAHSALVSPELMELAADIVPVLPNLSALIYEILPQYIPNVGLNAIRGQLEDMRTLWGLRREACDAPNARLSAIRRLTNYDDHDDSEVQAWEAALVAAINGCASPYPAFSQLHVDPALPIFRKLITDGRRSSIARGLKYSITLLLLNRGTTETLALLDQYFENIAPEAFVAMEADKFTRFIETRNDLLAAVPYLAETLNFERALIRAVVYSESSTLNWTVSPALLFEALDEARIPDNLAPLCATMCIDSRDVHPDLTTNPRANGAAR
jgi:uncharacterized protein (UPF0276 family)